MVTTFEHMYNIGDTVYHKLSEAEKGLIIDIEYTVTTNSVIYLISIGWNNSIWVDELELTNKPIFK